MNPNVTTLYDTPQGRKVNEDTLLADMLRHFYGVFDGAGSLTPDVSGLSTTGAKSASQIISRAFAVGLVDGQSVKEAVLAGNRELSDMMYDYSVPLSGDDHKTRRWGTTAAGVRLNKDNFDWVTVGDSVIVVVKRDGSFILPGGYEYDHDQEALLKLVELRDNNFPADEINAELWPILLRVRNRANIDYGVINGEPAVEKFIHHGTLQYDNISDIIMLTDGLFPMMTDPVAPDDWVKWVMQYQKMGLQSVCTHVRTLQKKDPLCMRYPRLKKSDDIAAVALTFV